MCQMKASLINIRLTSRYSAGSYAFAVKGLCALFSAFKIRSGTQFDGCTDLSTLCRDKSHTYLPLPQIVCLNSPRFWETHDQRFPGSLSLSRSVGRVGENPGNEVERNLVAKVATQQEFLITKEKMLVTLVPVSVAI